jgi:hypothetical protein
MYLLRSCSLYFRADYEFVSLGEGMAAAVLTKFVASRHCGRQCLYVTWKTYRALVEPSF